MRVKRCYPQGCIYFLWRCKLLNKGAPCPRGYKHVGRKCFGCKHFYDEKVTNQLEVQLTESEFKQFLEDLRDFEDWLQENMGKEVSLAATIQSVKPKFEKRVQGSRVRVRLSGFMITLQRCFVGMTAFEDLAYVAISTRLQEKCKFREGDQLECTATFGMDKGRIVFYRPRRIELARTKDEARVWSRSESLAALSTATWFASQPERCIACPYGLLVHVLETQPAAERKYRQLCCLKGITDERYCYVHAMELLRETCDREELPFEESKEEL